jgi:hypothetical protein
MPAVIMEGAKLSGRVYCTLCARAVDAEIAIRPKNGSREASLRVTPGQSCPRCSGPLDAALVMD